MKNFERIVTGHRLRICGAKLLHRRGVGE
jgi:hypothetical protein